MSPPRKYDTEEEKIKAYKAQQNAYSMQDWKCDLCDIVIKLGNKSKHLNSNKHWNKVYSDNGKSDKTWRCDTCNVVMHIYSKEQHLKTLRHSKNLSNENVDINSETGE
jgi:hypothetical protein